MRDGLPADDGSNVTTPRRWWRVGGGESSLRAAVAWACVVAIAYLAIPAEIEWRHRLWEQTATIRFTADVNNALHWGRVVVAIGVREASLPSDRAAEMTWRQFLHGYRLSYDAIYQRAASDGEFGLDYAPLRLLAMSIWTWDLVSRDPAAATFRDADAAPLLAVNRWVGAASALLGSVLAVLWLRRGHPDRGWFATPRTVLLSALVAVSIWLNPAALWNGHAWPQWDTWLVPFFLLAAIAATLGWWTLAGASMVVGAMLKGQILFAFPLLLLWPVFRGQWHAAGRFLLGAAATMLLGGSPWLLHAPAARAYVLLASMVTLLALLLPWKPRRWTVSLVALLVAGALAWPIITVAPRLLPLTLGLAAVVTLLGAYRWRRHVLPVVLLVFVVTTLVAAKRFGGSWSWYQIGFAYPERNYEAMHMGPTFNLPAILARAWGWTRESIALEIDPGRWTFGWLGGEKVPVSLKLLLRVVSGWLVLLSAWALARADRHSDPRGLLTFALPFLVVFALVPQMHERYLVWAAMVGGLALACSLPASFLLIVITAAALGQMMLTQLRHDRGFAPDLLKLLEGVDPHFGWAVLLAVLSWLFIALTLPSRRSPPVETKGSVAG